MNVPVVAVDGPVGVGKGTVSHALARHLGFHLLDSGAIYRVLALAASDRGASLDDGPGLAALAARLDLEFVAGDGEDPVRVLLDGDDVSARIRTEQGGRGASLVAGFPGVRAALLARQRGFRRAPGLVADGRDMGTVVFPDAKLKLFLTASPEARAERRYKQLMGKGISVSLAALRREVAERDRRDRDRAASPLVPAGDAEVVDTTDMDAEAVMAHALAACQARGLGARA